MTSQRHDSGSDRSCRDVVGLLFDKKPEIFEAYIDKIILNLANDASVAVKRNTVRMLQSLNIPSEHEGFLMETCFQYLLSKDEPIAIKVFSMTILSNLSEKYPDIKNELAIVIEDLMHHGSAGIISRGKKILRKLRMN